VLDDSGLAPIHYAAIVGNHAAVKLLLASNAHVNTPDLKSGNTALHHSIVHHRYTVAECLVKAGAEIELKNKNSETPLHVAVKMGDVVMMKLLLSVGADVHKRGLQRWAPIHFAAKFGFAECLRILINDYSADVTARTDDKSTALHIATTEECATMLVYVPCFPSFHVLTLIKVNQAAGWSG
jgi:ankyrin repeat protein